MARKPSIMIPYPGPCLDPAVQDIAIYLRPESNGVKVESTILKVIHSDPNYRKALEIIYLANLPGDFIVRNRIIEEHYALKVRFAREGKEAFTPTMRRRFEEYFSSHFETSHIVGAYEALKILRKSAKELFQIWVPEGQFTRIHQQSVKKVEGIYIVNYDIPALLQKNSWKTDVFSMIIRSFLPYVEFHRLIDSINGALKREGIITNPTLYSHVFHYSKGPFEQILDGIGYIYTSGDRHIDISQLSFFSYLLSRGCSKEEIMQSILNPITRIRTVSRPNRDARIEERHLFSYTLDNSFDEAYRKFQSRVPA
ncbi:MAG TPA: hypothetical protein VMX75_07005 [Spirochaetia bacterium]|nr:hypothetical protein [Spirochaetia bacterium]